MKFIFFNNNINYNLYYCDYLITSRELTKLFIDCYSNITFVIIIKTQYSFHKYDV